MKYREEQKGSSQRATQTSKKATLDATRVQKSGLQNFKNPLIYFLSLKNLGHLVLFS